MYVTSKGYDRSGIFVDALELELAPTEELNSLVQ